jgi:carboxymethylenebutenolidase
MNELLPAHMEQLTVFGGIRDILDTPDGPMDIYRFMPAHQTGLSLLFYCDAGGVRPAMFEMARQLADFGHGVLMPNLYHRLGTYAPFNAHTVFSDKPEMERLLNMLGSLSEAKAMQDTALALQTMQGSIGAIGYCLGGSMALRAAAYYTPQVEAAASIHGGALATDADDSPHLLVPRIHGKLYFGVAGIDPHFPKTQKERLESALKKAGTAYQMTVFSKAHHGFAVPDVPEYDPSSAEASWTQIRDFFVT